MEPSWLDLARRLQALAQTGLEFTSGEYDKLRYAEAREIAARLMALGSGEELERIESLFARETGYATPKVDVRGVVGLEGRLLLVQERTDGRWSLPGGWAEPGLSPAENVEKEIREESGLQTRAERLIAVFDRARRTNSPSAFSVYKMLFRCTISGGSLAPSLETAEAAFFAENELPPLSEGRTAPWHVARAFAHLRDHDLPTDFD